MRARVVPRTFYARDPQAVAPELLGKILVHGNVRGRIVEVEAYDGADDAASHAYRGETPRNAVMFGEPGRLYVYFTYGMHYCCNVVCRPKGNAAAVLIRALAPISGIEEMRERRGARRDHDLASGPAKLCQALAIDRSLDGVDLCRAGGEMKLLDDDFELSGRIFQGPRIGIREGTELPWRWWVEGDPNVSRPK